MRVLVFEPKYVGHFLGFAAVTANAFAELGFPTTLLFSREAETTPQASIKLEHLHDQVEVHFVLDVPKLYDRWRNAPLETAALEKALNQFETEHLVIPSGDFLLSGLLTNGRLRRRLRRLGGVDLVLHNCHQVYPDMGIRHYFLSLLDRLALSVNRGICVHSVDPFACSDTLDGRTSLFGNPVRSLPHFRETKLKQMSQAQARQSLGLSARGRMLGSIGDLGRRKGTELLIESFARSEPPPDGFLVLFGLLSGTARQLLSEYHQLVERGSIIVRNEFVSDEEFACFFHAMDAVWAGFPRQIGIASTQLYAAEANKPVIASDYAAVGWLTEEYGLGRTFPADVASMTEAIRWFFSTPGWAPDSEGVRRLLEYHTTENFSRHITDQIRTRAAHAQQAPVNLHIAESAP